MPGFMFKTQAKFPVDQQAKKQSGTECGREAGKLETQLGEHSASLEVAQQGGPLSPQTPLC